MLRARLLMSLVWCLSIGWVVLPLAAPAAAQSDLQTRFVYPQSFRYRLEIPTNWYSRHQLTPVDSPAFIGEVLYFADSQATFEAWRVSAITGAVMQVEFIPHAMLTAGLPTDANLSDADLLRLSVGLRSAAQDSDAVEDTPINGFPAVTRMLPTQQFLGDVAYAAWTSILVDDAIYRFFYASAARADRELHQTLLRSFQVMANAQIEPPAPRRPLDYGNAAFQFPLAPDWIVLNWIEPYAPFSTAAFRANFRADNIVQDYVILMEDSSAFVELLFQDRLSLRPDTPPALPGTFAMLRDHSNRLVTAAPGQQIETLTAALIDEMRATPVTPETAGDVVALPRGQVVELTDVFGGDNRGVLAVINLDFNTYSLTVAGPAATWETTGQAFAQQIFDSLMIAPPLPTITEERPGTVGTNIGFAAPNFTGSTLTDETLTLRDLRGSKVLLTFWATWCIPCHTEMPLFQQVFEERDDLIVIGVNFRENEPLIQDFVDTYGLTFPIVEDRVGAVSALYEVESYPTSYLIDEVGIIRLIPHFDPDAGIDGVRAWLNQLDDQ
ncbi:MAG: redoxin domain-containing protein [Chloroflexi bacterium]|nr:redoxin domain-containing protein [Chloroflexota bacterium]